MTNKTATEKILVIGLIHNQEIDRENVEEIVRSATTIFRGKKFNVKTIEEWHQDRVSSPSSLQQVIELSRQEFKQRLLERAWTGHIKENLIRKTFKRISSHLMFPIKIGWIIVHASARQKNFKIRQIEKFVTRKHLAILKKSQQMGGDYTLVFEADAFRMPETDTGFRNLQRVIEKSDDQKNLYVNLSGGFEWDAIGAKADYEMYPSSGFWKMQNSTTNTSCAYLVNRAFLDSILDFVDRDKSLSEYGIDWLLNAVFLEIDSPAAMICVHTNPPVVSHGSMLGITKSWNPRNQVPQHKPVR